MREKFMPAHEAEEEQISDENTKRQVVIPGEVIVSGEDYLPGDGVRRDGENVVASKFGLAEIAGRVVKVISLSGAYVPRRSNVIIGRITDVLHNGWLLDVDAPGNAFLPVADSPRFIPASEMDQFLAIGDIVAAKIWTIKGRGIDLTIKGKGLGKLEGGFMFRVTPNRVPRIIGREGSMINLIKEQTGCDITVGQNGWVWIKGEIDNTIKARRAIEHIAEKVHVGGLTERMEEWFTKN